jgi:septal ring factor EnvC (AmiA/AmiB activator)
MPSSVNSPSSSLPLSDPARAAHDALLLLATGRTDMARVALERLPALIADALAAANGRAEALADADRKLEGVVAMCDRAGARLARAEAEVARREAEARDLDARLARTRRELAAAEADLSRRRRDLEREPIMTVARGRPKPHEVLSRALASGAVTPERVAALLRVEPRHVAEVAAGRVGLGPATWRRVLAALDREGR